MRRLPFRATYREPIITGRKRGTIRRGRVHVDPGDQLLATFGRKLPCVLRVERVCAVRFDGLRRSDATRDGFASLDELRERLGTTYPGLSSADLLTLIHFTLDTEATRELHHAALVL